MKREEPITAKGVEEQRAQRLKEIARASERQGRLFQEVYARPTRALAIKAKCIDCSGFQTEEVRFCRVVTCPLWSIRPFRPAAEIQLKTAGKTSRKGNLAGLEKAWAKRQQGSDVQGQDTLLSASGDPEPNPH